MRFPLINISWPQHIITFPRLKMSDSWPTTKLSKLKMSLPYISVRTVNIYRCVSISVSVSLSPQMLSGIKCVFVEREIMISL